MATGVTQALQIMELLADSPEGLTVSAVAELLKTNKAIPFRLLAALIKAGYVEHDGVSNRYRLTYRVGALGLRQLEAAGIQDWAQPPLDLLAAKTGELARLAVASDNSLFWLAKSEGAKSQLRVTATDREISLHSTASGKAWLSTLADKDVEKILANRPLESHTAGTRSSIEDVIQDLNVVRSNGFAVVHGERDEGVSAVAVPVFGTAGHGATVDAPALGTVSLAGPSIRLTQQAIEDSIPALLEAASTIAAHWPAFRQLQRHRSVPTPELISGS